MLLSFLLLWAEHLIMLIKEHLKNPESACTVNLWKQPNKHKEEEKQNCWLTEGVSESLSFNFWSFKCPFPTFQKYLFFPPFIHWLCITDTEAEWDRTSERVCTRVSADARVPRGKQMKWHVDVYMSRGSSSEQFTKNSRNQSQVRLLYSRSESTEAVSDQQGSFSPRYNPLLRPI